MKKLPSSLKITWYTKEKDLPKKYGIYVILLRDEESKKEKITFGEFIPNKTVGKINLSRWEVLGMLFGDIYAYGKYETVKVIAWGKCKEE